MNIYQDGILVGYEDFDGKKRYVLTDHEGSVHIVLNESGDVIEENLFSPFAEPLEGVNINKFSYEAKEYDPLTKDYNFNFRMFSSHGPPILNQPDTLIQNVYDPQLLNRYSFERNNPMNRVDKDGHVSYIALVAILVLVIVESDAFDYIEETGSFLLDLGTTYYEEKQKEKQYMDSLITNNMQCPYGDCTQGYITSVHPIKKDEPTKNTPCYGTNCPKRDIFGNVVQNTQQNNRVQTIQSNIQNNANRVNFNPSYNQGNSNTGYGPNVAGYVTGQGYYTGGSGGGSFYPTKNKDFKPGTGNKPPSVGKETGCRLNCAATRKSNPNVR